MSRANSALTGPNAIYVIGSRMMSTELGNVSEAVNRSFLNLDFDYRKLERVARTVFATASELANLPARPRVDKQLPNELSGR